MEDNKQRLQTLVRGAFERRRQSIVFALAKKLARTFEEKRVAATPKDASPADTEWIAVESLSQLRAVVGGRFQNIKQKWIESGFPLREHRGDRSSQAEVNLKGWQELSLWIHSQGFEAELCGDESDAIFQVRKLSENKKTNDA